jgi:hypothetical protein
MTSAIRALAEQEENELGNHLDPELLADYMDGLLTPEEAARVQAHLAVCRSSFAVYKEMKETLQLEDDEEEETSRLVKQEPSHNRGKKRLSFWGSQAWAAGFAAVAFISLIINFVFISARQVEEPQTNLAIIDLLTPTVTVERGLDYEIQRIEKSDAVDGFVLILNLVGIPSQDRYTAQILDEQTSSILWERDDISPLDPDFLPIRLPGAFLNPGTYKILLFGFEDGQQKKVAEYPFLLEAAGN